ncbi:ATP-binding cassette domain-containing protein [Palleronia sediminis]|uniref:ATP-binding cassette domain-containing protein n=1 Tax=Palleronia sediminis TaxID=2547833 RepID=A0A4R6AIM0_9RHOB|nr:ATP-binding cassette domain-containing protein [Palleronia sediminis]TDL81526.1 ATP-binding cassette domain-containing protein [Palleronia sediminis]
MSEGLRLADIRIALDGRQMIALDRAVRPGAVLTVMGPSGSGKSTLLAFLTGTLPPAFTARGRIVLDGRDVTDLPAHRRGIGILFQDHMLFPHLSVAGNLGFGARGGNRAQRRARIADALTEVGLEGFGDRDPATLSGGQRARVALMRTLLAMPRALLLDEPFSGLDANMRSSVRGLVLDHARRRGLPVVLVTHDAEDAEAAGGEIFRIGRI